jgi:transcriptional regulator CtsR
MKGGYIMIERSAKMTFKDVSGKKVNLIVKDVKENVLDADISALMDSVLTNKLIKTEAGDLMEMVEAKVITKETTTVAL